MSPPPAGKLVTSLDVLDDYFGGVPSVDSVQELTLSQIDELGERVIGSAARLSRIRPDVNAVGELVYPGGWIANGWMQGLFRNELDNALLYEPRLLIHDPLAEYFFSDFNVLPKYTNKQSGSIIESGARLWADTGRRLHRGDDLAGIRADLESIFRVLNLFEPLIRSGTIVLRSQFPIIERQRYALETSARKDLQSERMLAAVANVNIDGLPLPQWDNLRGAHLAFNGVTPNRIVDRQWEPEFYYLAKTLLFSQASSAFYAPPSENELTLLQSKSESYLEGTRSFAPKKPLLEEVLRATVPGLHLDPFTVLKMRDSEEAFDAWRRKLRELQRESAGTADADIPQLVDDLLQPEIAAVRKAVSKSEILRKNAPRNLALSIITGVGGLAGGLESAGVTAVATGVGGALMDMYFSRHLDGAKPVIATLLFSNQS